MANNLSTEKKTLAVSMLAEGNSIRSIERVTGVHRDTIMRLGVRIGEKMKNTFLFKKSNNCRVKLLNRFNHCVFFITISASIFGCSFNSQAQGCDIFGVRKTISKSGTISPHGFRVGDMLFGKISLRAVERLAFPPSEKSFKFISSAFDVPLQVNFMLPIAEPIAAEKTHQSADDAACDSENEIPNLYFHILVVVLWCACFFGCFFAGYHMGNAKHGTNCKMRDIPRLIFRILQKKKSEQKDKKQIAHSEQTQNK